ARYAKNSQGRKKGIFEPRMPTHFRLRSEQAKCLVDGEEKPMPEFRACFGREGICLFVEIMVRLRRTTYPELTASQSFSDVHRVGDACLASRRGPPRSERQTRAPR